MAAIRNDLEDFLIDPIFKDWVLNPNPILEQYWSEWLCANSDKRDTALMAREVILRMRFDIRQSDELTRSRIYQQILEKSNTVEVGDSRTLSYLVRIAAVLIMAVGITFYLILIRDQKNVLVAENKIVHENPAGKRSRLTLPDGTIVYLSFNSKIELPEDFERGPTREVLLDGEAYFEVTKDNTKPFVVKTRRIDIVVMGTQFNVKADEEESFVALNEGSVKAINLLRRDSLLLVPGEMASYLIKDSSMSVSTFDPEYYLGWKDGRIVFRDASLDDVVERLSDWYGIQFTIENKANSPQWTYSGSFENESLQNVLRSLSTVRDFKYEIRGNVVTIAFK